MSASLGGVTQLNTSLAERLREDRFGSLAVLDGDHFHRLNVERGAEVGDRVLRLVEAVLQERAGGFYHIGGDQYAVLDLDRDAVAQLAAAATLACRSQLQLPVSLSGGGVDLARDYLVHADETVHVLYGAASQMLTLAKQGGRDRILWVGDDLSGDAADVSRQVWRDLARVNASMARRMEEASRVDPLTGLFNRRGFDEVFGRLVDVARRSQRPLALLYMDSDTLKRVNDERGHDAGDRFIVDLASVLRAVARRSDFVFRWGADEFAVVLESGDEARAVALAERLRAAIAERTAGTVSIGLYCGVPASAEEAVRIADGAMYAAKAGGKDRIAVGRHEPPAG